MVHLTPVRQLSDLLACPVWKRTGLFISRCLVEAAIVPAVGRSPARKIWIDVALGRAARCRRVALSQPRVAPFVIVGLQAVHVQAHRVSPIVQLAPCWTS